LIFEFYGILSMPSRWHPYFSNDTFQLPVFPEIILIFTLLLLASGRNNIEAHRQMD
jgi:hypothetical protein